MIKKIFFVGIFGIILFGLAGLTSAQSTKFTNGDQVVTNVADISISGTAQGVFNGLFIGPQPLGATGIVKAGPVWDEDRWMWRIDFENDPDGWASEARLDKVTPDDGDPDPDGGSGFIGWQDPPPGTPPRNCDTHPEIVGCNPPINVSAEPQIKAGGLGVRDLSISSVGFLKLLGLRATAGKFLTTDSTGKVIFGTPSADLGGGDNLGNHIATQNLILGDNNRIRNSASGYPANGWTIGPYNALYVNAGGADLGQEAMAVITTDTDGSNVRRPFAVVKDSVCINGDCRNAWPVSGLGGGVSKIKAGTNITIDPTSGIGDVTINSIGGGSLDTSGLLSNCGNSVTGKVYWNGTKFVCAKDVTGEGDGGTGTVTEVASKADSGLFLTTDSDSALTNGGSFSSSGSLSLRTNCEDRQILKYINNTTGWQCRDDDDTPPSSKVTIYIAQAAGGLGREDSEPISEKKYCSLSRVKTDGGECFIKYTAGTSPVPYELYANTGVTGSIICEAV